MIARLVFGIAFAAIVTVASASAEQTVRVRGIIEGWMGRCSP